MSKILSGINRVLTIIPAYLFIYLLIGLATCLILGATLNLLEVFDRLIDIDEQTIQSFW